MLSSLNSSPQKPRSGRLPSCSSDENLSPRKYTNSHPHARFSSASMPSASQESLSASNDNCERPLWDPNATSITNTKLPNQSSTNSSKGKNTLLGNWLPSSWSSSSIGGGMSSGISAFAATSYSKISASLSNIVFSQNVPPSQSNQVRQGEGDGGLLDRAKAGMTAIGDKVLNGRRKRD